ncbi:MAG: IgGFc-binding protein, partial [Flavobacterium sp.]|nr:IgGFc-binding protein [Flavobacterium sp.]
MAINNGTTVDINGVTTTTLNAGQSYAFLAPMGTLVETAAPVVMNSNQAVDRPGGCSDGVSDQMAPELVQGTAYFVVRGQGNSTAEQTTVIATQPNTTLPIQTYNLAGTLLATTPVTITNAGQFYTFINGDGATAYSASRVLANKKVSVYSGTAQGSAVDETTISPVSPCAGSLFVETAKFRSYAGGDLTYYGYVLLRSGTSIVNVTIGGTQTNLITFAGARRQLGTTGWYLIDFNETQISKPAVILLTSTNKMTVCLIQQGFGFSMSAVFSNFTEIPDAPTFAYASGGGCANNSANLSTPSGFAPFQWYLNGFP